ncbi:hypothetical protein [Microcoleus sp. Pol12B5]|uniref:hypothetical protein n=1 Tax=Microcoleus sp. Pol12B5 TaxID=3055396 RepID=UPI002FD52675
MNKSLNNIKEEFTIFFDQRIEEFKTSGKLTTNFDREKVINANWIILSDTKLSPNWRACKISENLRNTEYRKVLESWAKKIGYQKKEPSNDEWYYGASDEESF